MAIQLTSSSETGSIGIMHLKRYWEKGLARRNGSLAENTYQEEWNLDVTLLGALGLGLEQTITFLYQSAPRFEEFEQWVLKVNGGAVSHETILGFNSLIAKNETTGTDGSKAAAVLTADDLGSWNENGYIIVRQAVSKEDCTESVRVI